MSRPNTQQVLNVFLNNANGVTSLLTIDNIKCEQLTVGDITIGSDGLIIDSATIGGLTFANETITGPTINFVSESGSIDCGGATLTNVAGIVTNPNFYTSVYQGINTGIGQTVFVGLVPLTGNSIVIIEAQFIASRSNGSNICAKYSYKTNYLGGLMDFKDYGPINLVSDEPALDLAAITLSQSGSSIQINASGVALYPLSWFITCTITILPL